MTDENSVITGKRKPNMANRQPVNIGASSLFSENRCIKKCNLLGLFLLTKLKCSSASDNSEVKMMMKPVKKMRKKPAGKNEDSAKKKKVVASRGEV